MDDILEFVFEFVMEIITGIAEDKSKPRWLRYLANGLMGIFMIAVIGFLVQAGILWLNNSRIGGIIYFAILLVLALLLTVFFIRRRRKTKKEELEPLEREWQ